MKIWSILHLPRLKPDARHPLQEPDLAPESMPWTFVRGTFVRGPFGGGVDSLPWPMETGRLRHVR